MLHGAAPSTLRSDPGSVHPETKSTHKISDPTHEAPRTLRNTHYRFELVDPQGGELRGGLDLVRSSRWRASGRFRPGRSSRRRASGSSEPAASTSRPGRARCAPTLPGVVQSGAHE